MTRDNVEAFWSRELQADVQLMETDYEGVRVFIDASHVHTARGIADAEQFLYTVSLLNDIERDGF